MQNSIEPNEVGGSVFREFLLHAAVVAVVCLLFARVLANPNQILYSPLSDILAQHYPYRHLMVESIRNHWHLPTWNPTAFCGMPLVGDPQSGLFYPPNWLHALSPADECAPWFGYLIVAHLIVGGWGTLWWLAGHRFAAGPRLAGALAFMFCGKWILHVVVPGHIVFLPLVFLPWQLGLIDRLWQRPRLHLAALLAATTAFAILGSHSQQLFYSHLLLLCYTPISWHYFGRPDCCVRAAIYIVCSGATSLLLAAVHLLPIFDLLDYVVRGHGVPYSMAARRSQQWSDYITFLLPSRAENGHWENTSYLGVAASALALFGLLDRRSLGLRLLFVAVIAFTLFFGVGENGVLHRFLFDYAPGFGLFRIPTRIFLVLGIPIAYLAAAGVSRLSEELPSKLSRVIAVLLAVTAFLLLFDELTWDSTFAGAALFGVALLALAPSPKRYYLFVTSMLVGILLIDQARFIVPKIETRTLRQALGDNPLVERLKAPLGKQRYVALNYAKPGMYSALPVTYATPHRLESVRGFNPLIPECTFRYVRTGVGGEEYKGFYGTGIREFNIASRPHLDLLNVRWIATDQPVDIDGFSLRQTYNDLRVYHFSSEEEFTVLPTTHLYENTKVHPRVALIRSAVPVASIEEAIARIGHLDAMQQVLIEDDKLAASFPGAYEVVEDVEHGGDEIRIRVDAGEGGYLLLSEMWYPGWRARVDGRRARPLRMNGVFLGLQLGPGVHTVHFYYRPWSYRIGWSISVASLVCVLMAMVAGPVVATLRSHPQQANQESVRTTEQKPMEHP